MNRQTASLFRLFAIGFAVLITLTAYWQIWAADSLATRRDNARLVYRQLQIKRGLIYASNGRTVLAENHPRRRGGLRATPRSRGRGRQPAAQRHTAGSVDPTRRPAGSAGPAAHAAGG